MSFTHEFTVVEPPTSGEVKEQALQAMQAEDGLPLTILVDREVPKPEPEDVTMRIIAPSFPRSGGMHLLGRTLQDEIIFVAINGKKDEPATGNLTRR